MAVIEARRGGDFVAVATNGHSYAETADSKFFTRDGWLTGYALACGYVETAQGIRIECRGDEFHVTGGGEEWAAFMKLNEARKEFTKRVKAELVRELEALGLAVDA